MTSGRLCYFIDAIARHKGFKQRPPRRVGFGKSAARS
jgi:hypothetical protein